jgi:uncharacterized protein (DUF433 family)
MAYNEYIALDSAVMVGKPCIKGTRIAVELVVRKLGEGATIPELLEAYPRLKEEHIYASLQYAAA